MLTQSSSLLHGQLTVQSDDQEQRVLGTRDTWNANANARQAAKLTVFALNPTLTSGETMLPGC